MDASPWDPWGSGCEHSPKVGALQMVPGRWPQGMDGQKAQGLQRADVHTSLLTSGPCIPPCTALLSLPPFPASHPLQPLLLNSSPFSLTSHNSVHPAGPFMQTLCQPSHFLLSPVSLPAPSATSQLCVPQHLIPLPHQALWSHQQRVMAALVPREDLISPGMI